MTVCFESRFYLIGSLNLPSSCPSFSVLFDLFLCFWRCCSSFDLKVGEINNRYVNLFSEGLLCFLWHGDNLNTWRSNVCLDSCWRLELARRCLSCIWVPAILSFFANCVMTWRSAHFLKNSEKRLVGSVFNLILPRRSYFVSFQGSS